MKPWIAPLCLALLNAPVLAATPPSPPNARFDGILSPARPLSIDETQRQPRTASQAIDTPTFTYLRCYYRQSLDPNQPDTSYVWGRDQVSGDYYRLQGVWRSGGALPWQSMFYSEVAQPTLQRICRQTLALDAGGREPVLVAAANNALSYNHAIWSLASLTPGTGIERMVAFGDSLSDTQNMYAISQWKAPQNPTWFLGRFSNGPVWVERLATLLDLPLYNWAIGGAAGDRVLVLPGVRQQVASWREYARADPGYRPERTLFTLWIGGNDLINYDRTPEKVIEDVHATLTQLLDQGARHLVVLNLPDLARTPLVQTRGNGAKLTAQVDTFNALLAALLGQLSKTYGAGVSLQLFDMHTLFDDIIAHPSRYQVDNVSDSCLDTSADPDTSLRYMQRHSPQPACVNADRYLFWDPLHPSARTHAQLAEYVAAFLRNSASLTRR
ncbi:SGNH/GDSL hydrolase family protein [Paludibacterium purpuratum]|uniref:Thermolabile hemolysin n=1 Tax=Paludibacterium purpuratum TaxID=1144873 RepID=A0A4R7B7Q5_9NEIS|nr:SGNH/GDSL hydrolase family protein [Paludibacterium purpuratum]TDR79805.1 thermolabile hemolysin [Paludibacterium purpuratum]